MERQMWRRRRENVGGQRDRERENESGSEGVEGHGWKKRKKERKIESELGDCQTAFWMAKV